APAGRRGRPLPRPSRREERALPKWPPADNSRTPQASRLASVAAIPSQSRPPASPARASRRPEPTLQRVKELRDEIPRHATEHALADGRNLTADIGFVTILEMGAVADLGAQADKARSRSEAQRPEGLADEAHRTFLLFVTQLDLHVIGAANAGNTDDDLRRVAIRTVLGEAATSRDDGSKLARIEEPTPHLLDGSGQRDFPASRQRPAADRRPLCLDLRCDGAPSHVMPVRERPHAPQVQRQRNIIASERISDGVCDHSGGEHRAAVPHALRAERIDGRSRFDVADLDVWNFDGCRTKII